MMKTKYTILLTVFIALFAFASCKDTKEEEIDGGGKTENKENQKINNWILKEMKEKYYWNDYVWGLTSLDLNAEPNDFYYSTLYYAKDRFSSISKNGVYQVRPRASTESTPKKDIGFEFSTITGNGRVYGLCVLYVKGGSEAEKQGLKRGDIIKKVDNSSITEDNWYSALYEGKTSYKLVFYNRDPLTLNTTSNFVEKPVHTTKTFDEGRVGYIMYNFFDNDSGDDSYEYALKMNDELTKMSAVEYLILDLRYNGGGLVESGAFIGSALVPDRGTGNDMKIYTRRVYNKTYDAILQGERNYDKQISQYFYEKIINVSIPQLKNLKKLYVLTTSNTASASEQIINALSAYIKVEVIGEITKGKNMESIPLSDEKNHKWELNPLVSVSYRHDKTPETNDYSHGIPPTIPKGEETSEATIYMDASGNLFTKNFYDLGDEKETLLSKALADIRGVQPVSLRSKRSIESGIPLELGHSSLDLKDDQMIIKIEE